jgi:UDP-glucose 4-epimerase
MAATDLGTLLVTGGAGFIGSHTCVDLLDAGYDVVVVDNLANSSEEALRRVQELTGRELAFEQFDIRDTEALARVIDRHDVGAVVHFAALKAVGESVEIPVEYYDNNINGTLSLVRAMRRHGVRRLVFSSSCSIHGDAENTPIDEAAPAAPTNPYARTKWFMEQILADTCIAEPDWSVISLRYFNPTGAHPSGLIGEDPRGIPNNLMPFAMQVAAGRLEKLRVFGDDYATHDGTGVRDYIHVDDLAVGHRLALERLDDAPGHRVYNLGTGVGSSVLDVVRAAEKACGKAIPYEIVGRRPGDVTALVADPSLAERELGWTTSRDLDAMCADAWRFQERNPDGYGD